MSLGSSKTHISLATPDIAHFFKVEVMMGH